MHRLIVEPGWLDVAALEDVARAIREGRVVAIPTDTLYGLAVDPFQPAAVDKIFEVKGRSVERALPVTLVRVSPGHCCTTSAGRVNVGGVVSIIVIVCKAVTKLPQASFARHVR